MAVITTGPDAAACNVCCAPFTHYSPEGRCVLRRRALAERLLAQAEQDLVQVEMNPTAKRRALEHAMRLVRAARALHQQERPKRTRRKHKVQSQEPLR